MSTPRNEELTTLLELQDGVVTTSQAYAAGLSRGQVRTLLDRRGWTRPTRGILVAPDPVDPFRASVRSALLACPGAVASGVTAARLHELWMLRRWTPAEAPSLLIAAGITHVQRHGMRRRSGLHAEETVVCAGFPTTTLERTVHDLAVVLPFDELLCVLDSALRKGWVAAPDRRARSLLAPAAAVADGRSESPLETLLRLLLVRAGLVPESLQFEVTGPGGFRARLDMAWPGVRLAVEADGREVHSRPAALYEDRRRANNLQLLGWTILRFTWADVTRNPEWVVAQVRTALEHLAMAANRRD